MAKKKSGFNMAQAIRAILEADNALSSKQVLAALKKKFPRQKINESSCGVAFSGARKKLGIGGTRKMVRRRKPVARSSSPVDFDVLRAAKQYLAACGGDSDTAITAVKQIRSLQIT